MQSNIHQDSLKAAHYYTIPLVTVYTFKYVYVCIIKISTACPLPSDLIQNKKS